jgi:hypothetical protein
MKFLIAMLVATACYGEEAAVVKPVCSAETQGKLWPEKTSRGSGVPVEICVARHWKYRWEQLTVDVSQLKGRHKPAIAAVTRAAGTKASSMATPPD